jgi:thiamine-phosphate pyrophosphorylase
MPGDESSAILRVVDANANRAREALRVMEDYARFVLSDQELSLAIKSLRHDLSAALKPISGDGLLHRDTPSDVGTGNKTPQELSRRDLAEVVTAAGKRLSEALRTIEEFCKVSMPQIAVKIEAIRYAGYDIEQRLGRTLRHTERFRRVRLYVVLSESACRINWLEAAKAAIAGGADCIQLREKSLEGGELLSRARALVAECHRQDVLCIINDRPDVAVLSGADGVHVGQGDLPAVEARKIVGSGAIVGVSTHNVGQARQAVLDGADYIGIGPMFRSSTKPRDFVVGPAGAREVVAAVKIPVVAIAGITTSNVDEVWSAGVSAIAVTAAVLDDDDVRAATARLAAPLAGRVRAAK